MFVGPFREVADGLAKIGHSGMIHVGLGRHIDEARMAWIGRKGADITHGEIAGTGRLSEGVLQVWAQAGALKGETGAESFLVPLGDSLRDVVFGARKQVARHERNHGAFRALNAPRPNCRPSARRPAAALSARRPAWRSLPSPS